MQFHPGPKLRQPPAEFHGDSPLPATLLAERIETPLGNLHIGIGVRGEGHGANVD